MQLFEGKPGSVKARPMKAEEMLVRFGIRVEDDSNAQITIRNARASQTVVDHRGNRVGLDRTRQIPTERVFQVGPISFFARVT